MCLPVRYFWTERDIRKIRLDDLRRQIGIVQQDVYLFAGTIMENIRYGKPDATDEEVIRAAKAANAHDFIMEMPEDYDTDIGQRGVKLSGGQSRDFLLPEHFLRIRRFSFLMRRRQLLTTKVKKWYRSL